MMESSGTGPLPSNCRGWDRLIRARLARGPVGATGGSASQSGNMSFDAVEELIDVEGLVERRIEEF